MFKQPVFAVFVCLGLLSAEAVAGQIVADFEDLSLSPETFNNGSDGSDGFASAGIQFSNDYNSEFNSWSGFAYSNLTDTTTAGFLNQHSSFAGSGAGGSANYGVAFVSSFGPTAQITLPEPTTVNQMSITNTTYAALSMLQGDDFAKKFGGPTGDDPDFLRLAIHGRDATGAPTGSVPFFLADFRFSDNSRDYVIDEWTDVDLTDLGANVKWLEFEMETTDVGMFGANTPLYFALDNLTIQSVPEPAALSLAILSGSLFFMCRRRCASVTSGGKKQAPTGPPRVQSSLCLAWELGRGFLQDRYWRYVRLSR